MLIHLILRLKVRPAVCRPAGPSAAMIPSTSLSVGMQEAGEATNTNNEPLKQQKSAGVREAVDGFQIKEQREPSASSLRLFPPSGFLFPAQSAS